MPRCEFRIGGPSVIPAKGNRVSARVLRDCKTELLTIPGPGARRFGKSDQGEGLFFNHFDPIDLNPLNRRTRMLARGGASLIERMSLSGNRV
jgi:hypothetical protein